MHFCCNVLLLDTYLYSLYHWWVYSYMLFALRNIIILFVHLSQPRCARPTVVTIQPGYTTPIYNPPSDNYLMLSLCMTIFCLNCGACELYYSCNICSIDCELKMYDIFSIYIHQFCFTLCWYQLLSLNYIYIYMQAREAEIVGDTEKKKHCRAIALTLNIIGFIFGLLVYIGAWVYIYFRFVKTHLLDIDPYWKTNK